MLDYDPSSGEIEIFNSVPAHYQKLLRPGAKFTHIKVDFADLVFQKITGDGFDIHCGFTDGKGYRDLSNFCVAFSMRNTCTPLEYQKKNDRRLRL